MAPKKTPPKDAEVVGIADTLLALTAQLSALACPVCGSYLLSARIIPHSGVRIECGGFDESASGDDADNCTFARVRRLSAPVVKRNGAKAELIAVSFAETPAE